MSTDSLSIRAPHVDGDRRGQRGHDEGDGAPTPSSAYRQHYNSRGGGPSSITPGHYQTGGSMASDVVEVCSTSTVADAILAEGISLFCP